MLDTKDNDVDTISEADEPTLSIPLAVFTLISVIIGGGIVSSPNSMLIFGFPFGIFFFIFNAVAGVLVVYMFSEVSILTKME